MATITRKFIKEARRRGVTVYSQSQWGALRTPIYAWRRKFRKHKYLPGAPCDTLWQHISVTRRTRNFKADVRKVEEIGWNRFKTGASYNILIDMHTGEVAVAMPLDAAGAHTINDKDIDGYSKNQNYVSLAICVIGMPATRLSRVAEIAISKVIASLISVGALTHHLDYNPHSMVAWKECPCDPTRNKMPRILKRAKRILPC